MLAYLKGEVSRITPEISLVPGDLKKGNSVLDALSKSNVSLALRVSF